jgi:nucleotide-binding universal stress UspA family protein
MTEDLPFKVVRSNGTDEVLARAMNLLVARDMKPAEMPWRTSSAAAWSRHSAYADSADAPLSPRLVGISVLPEPLEPIGRQRRIAHRRRDRSVAEIVLDRARIVPVIGQLVAAAVPQHVAVDGTTSRMSHCILRRQALYEQPAPFLLAHSELLQQREAVEAELRALARHAGVTVLVPRTAGLEN